MQPVMIIQGPSGPGFMPAIETMIVGGTVVYLSWGMVHPVGSICAGIVAGGFYAYLYTREVAGSVVTPLVCLA